MQPKLRLASIPRCVHHRSGWSYALDALRPLLSPDGTGVLLDSMIEKTFSRELDQAIARGQIPYRQPWIGIVHVPPEVPEWFDPTKTLQRISRLEVWQESLAFCRGLITLSEWRRRILETEVPLPTLALRHPTEIPAVRFDFARYMANRQRRVIQVGWYARRLCSIQQLPVRKLRRALLIPFPYHEPRFWHSLQCERQQTGAPPLEEWEVEILPYQEAAAYDELLAENVVFLDLYPCVAVNALIECIARNTPVIVRPQASVVEYLGENYPLYFDSLDEAAAKADDDALVRAAHEYLARMPKDWLTQESFCRSLAQSELYQRL